MLLDILPEYRQTAALTVRGFLGKMPASEKVLPTNDKIVISEKVLIMKLIILVIFLEKLTHSNVK